MTDDMPDRKKYRDLRKTGRLLSRGAKVMKERGPNNSTRGCGNFDVGAQLVPLVTAPRFLQFPLQKQVVFDTTWGPSIPAEKRAELSPTSWPNTVTSLRPSKHLTTVRLAFSCLWEVVDTYTCSTIKQQFHFPQPRT
jgi:hypothetical protein